MGVFFRKSVRMGPFRVNFSSSGIGVSAGIPGFRLGTGPRGNYIQVGGHGIYYRASLSQKRPSSSHSTAPARQTASRDVSPPIPENTVGQYQSVESLDAHMIVDSSSEELLEELRSKHKKIRAMPLTIGVCAVALALGLLNNAPIWVLVAGVVVGAVLTLVAYRWDVQRKLVILHYHLDEESTRDYQTLFESAAFLKNAARKWHITATAKVKDRKYHAGASSAIRRNKAEISIQQPPFLASNIDPIAISLSNMTFYFFPDRVLLYQGDSVGGVSYQNLKSTPSVLRFIEEDGVPSDAKVVDRTWKFVNKKGGPDRRFKNNRELPICMYGEIAFTSATGVNELLVISKQGPENVFSEALHRIALRIPTRVSAIPAASP